MVEYGFFDSVGGDRTYNADSFNEFFNGVISPTGVYKKSGDGLEVIPAESGLGVTISTGKARINEHWVNVASAEAITLDAANIALNRYDAIVLRYDATARSISAVVIKGTEASTAVKPTIYRNVNTYDICLAYVYIGAGATSITTANIEDTREDTDLCGYAKLQIDSINAGIREYRNTIEIAASTNQISIGIAQFDSANDLLFSNINGVMFVQDVDYTVTGTGSTAKINLNFNIAAGNTVEFRVIKSIIEVL